MKKITLLMLLIFITTITLHGQNKLLSSTNENYNGGNWQNSYGANYEYDSNNNLISETELSWNSDSSVWENTSKTTYIYNENNKVTQELYQNWSSTTNTWNNSYKSSYTYTNGKLTGVEDQDWENSNWVNDYKFFITYETNNLPQTYEAYIWVGTQWVIEDRSTLTYNTNNKIISSVGEEWIGSQWVNSNKSLYTYNQNNKLLTERSAEWDSFNNTWVEKNRTEFELDANGNRISETNYQGDSRYKDEYTYDTFNLMSSFAHPFKDKTGLDYYSEDFPYVNKVLTTTDFGFNANTNSYTSNLRTTYNYNSAITLSTETLEIADNSITFYPNPTSDFLNIQNDANTAIEKITVADLTGKKVIEQKQNTTQVNVQNFVKGIYVLEVYSGKEKFQSKFIKE